MNPGNHALGYPTKCQMVDRLSKVSADTFSLTQVFLDKAQRRKSLVLIASQFSTLHRRRAVTEGPPTPKRFHKTKLVACQAYAYADLAGK